MSTVTEPTKIPESMNAANPRDPYNNSSYGTLVDSPYKLVQLPVLDVCDFNERIIRGYRRRRELCHRRDHRHNQHGTRFCPGSPGSERG